MPDVKTLDKPIDRPSVAAFRVSDLVGSYDALDADGGVLKTVGFRVDLARLSKAALAEVEYLAEESLKAANLG